MRSPIIVVLLGLCATAAAQHAVLDPWGDRPNSPAAASTPTTMRGGQAHLSRLQRTLPSWVFHIVLDPWAEAVDRSLHADERKLSRRARARALRLARCFPIEHTDEHHFTSLTIEQGSLRTDMNTPLDRCLSQAIQGIQRPATDRSENRYTLCLRFDARGLREVLVLTTDRLFSS